MKITLKDGSIKEYAQAMSVFDIAMDISEGLARAACAGEVNGEVVDLRTVLNEDCSLSILTFDDEEGNGKFFFKILLLIFGIAIVVVIAMDSATGEIVSGPDVISRGFVYVRESENLMEDVKMLVNAEVMRCVDSHITDWATIKTNIRDSLKEYIFHTTKRNPMILPIIMEV